jgi:hypothetical protein
VWDKKFPCGAQRRLSGFQLSATDVSWTAGSGAVIEGPMGSPLLLMTGRTASLPELGGTGLAQLAGTA